MRGLGGDDFVQPQAPVGKPVKPRRDGDETDGDEEGNGPVDANESESGGQLDFRPEARTPKLETRWRRRPMRCSIRL